jgi:hypothetical protein
MKGAAHFVILGVLLIFTARANSGACVESCQEIALDATDCEE